jgi:hypothetical protein
VISRAMQDSTDLGSLSTAVARSIPLDADRRQFLIRVNDHWHPKPPSKVNGGGNATTPSSGSAKGYPDLSTADANLGLIEQTLARHIGPIARVVLKRAMTQSPTRDDLCEYLATHIEREDERRQFLATVTRWV